MRKIICIGRQFGSGGHFIARKFAERECIPYYDRKILDRASEASGIARDIMERADERMAHPLWQPLYYEGNSKKYYGKNANDILFEAQKEIILEDAKKSDAVFVGRCADYILREFTDYCVKSIFCSSYGLSDQANDGDRSSQRKRGVCKSKKTRQHEKRILQLLYRTRLGKTFRL